MGDLRKLETSCCGLIVILTQNEQEISHFPSLPGMNVIDDCWHNLNTEIWALFQYPGVLFYGLHFFNPVPFPQTPPAASRGRMLCIEYRMPSHRGLPASFILGRPALIWW
jgi:hypothetical protein